MEGHWIYRENTRETRNGWSSSIRSMPSRTVYVTSSHCPVKLINLLRPQGAMQESCCWLEGQCLGHFVTRRNWLCCLATGWWTWVLPAAAKPCRDPWAFWTGRRVAWRENRTGGGGGGESRGFWRGTPMLTGRHLQRLPDKRQKHPPSLSSGLISRPKALPHAVGKSQ